MWEAGWEADLAGLSSRKTDFAFALIQLSEQWLPEKNTDWLVAYGAFFR